MHKSILMSFCIIKTSEMVNNSGGQIDYQHLYDLLKPLLTDKTVIDSYNKWKNDLYGMTPEMLKHKRIQVILDVLKRGIMKHGTKPWNLEISNIP